MKIIKRNGQEVTFSKSNIINAISSANMRVPLDKRFNNDEIKQIASDIDAKVREGNHTIATTDVQDMVERAISSNYDVLKEYIQFRYAKELQNRQNTTDESILSLLNNSNESLKQENSNKNPTIVSTMRDYMAGEVSKDISRRYLIPSDIWEAHKNGTIHFHDMDYFSMPIHNCFTGYTKFITDKGIRQFCDFKDGDLVVVKDKDGVLREATVHSYGIQEMNEVTLQAGSMVRKIKVTPNHRWILQDGTVTTNLSVGDKLYKPSDSTESWIVKDIKPYKKKDCIAWCVEEPVTHSFMLEGGVVTGNCDLVNLEDMLQNGTMISGVLIESPKSFGTACNIATQIVAQVASSQYGGQTITLSHLAPFVDISRQKIKKELKEYFTDISEEELNEVVEKRVLREIESGIQTLNYQLITLQTTNGQTPFISVNMYLNEVEDEQTKADLALVIEEVLKQRILGVKNSNGQYVAPAFPKLLYVLEEDNASEDSKYWYLTQLAAECTAKRMVPDYISEKIMKELKKDKKNNGNCYPCMGCRSFLTPYIQKNGVVETYEDINVDLDNI